ncbi:hypothetical protein P5673_016449 [Acropora cervicornis]|uniref:Uncharacterized protein n=1 Tax=Acropora cervicornis TaxID=6130 RepID=A0AAD9V4D4_ACRCE|nr:hypothetical protein P5673_016449 [Acropora cervicornis]
MCTKNFLLNEEMQYDLTSTKSSNRLAQELSSLESSYLVTIFPRHYKSLRQLIRKGQASERATVTTNSEEIISMAVKLNLFW